MIDSATLNPIDKKAIGKCKLELIDKNDNVVKTVSGNNRIIASKFFDHYWYDRLLNTEIYLTNSDIEADDTDIPFMPGNLVARAKVDSTVTGTRGGSFVSSKSSRQYWTDDGKICSKFVFEFGLSQANGKITHVGFGAQFDNIKR